MDALDMRILRDIGIEPFAGTACSPHPWRPEELAERLKESPRLVKDRMARLERDGIVAGFDVQPNLALLGLASRTYAFPFAQRAGRAAILQRVSAMEGVLDIVDYVTDWATVTIAYADEHEHARRLDAVGAELGGLKPDTWFEMSVPPKVRELTRLDWRILRAMRGDARAALSDLAEKVGVTTKTIQRRLDAMAADRAFSAYAIVTERTMDELLMCSLVIRVDMSDVGKVQRGMGELHGRILADAWAHCSAPIVQDGVHHDLVAAPRSPRALADLLDATARTPGVLEVKAHLAAGVLWSPAWLDAQIDARIASMPTEP